MKYVVEIATKPQKAKRAKKLKKEVEELIEDEVEANDGVANLEVFNLVAKHMFSSPKFAAMMEEEYGIVIDNMLTAYLKMFGMVIAAVFGVHFVGRGMFKLGKFFVNVIWNVSYYSCIITAFLLHGMERMVPGKLKNRIQSEKFRKLDPNSIEVIAVPQAA